MKVRNRSGRIKQMEHFWGPGDYNFQSRLSSSYSLLISQQIYHESSLTTVFLKVWSAKRVRWGPPGSLPQMSRVVECGFLSWWVLRLSGSNSTGLQSSDSFPEGFKYLRNISIFIFKFLRTKWNWICHLFITVDSVNCLNLGEESF